MWQYWWWFWFTYYMSLYYFIFLRLIRHRVLKFSPKIVTSQKSHGKWGDFIVCFVPIAWCVNILSNSNFILRMMEWQTESSLFTVRVRGRQWYWVYKIELKDLLNVTSVTKNLGHDYWVFNKNIKSDAQKKNLNVLQRRTYNAEYLKAYKSVIGDLRNKNKSVNRLLDPQLSHNRENLKIYSAESAIWDENVTLDIFNVHRNNFASASFRANNYESDSGDVQRLSTLKRITEYKTSEFVTLRYAAIDYAKRDSRLRNYKRTSYLSVLKKNNTVWSKSSNSGVSRKTPKNLYFVIKQKRVTAPTKKMLDIPIFTRQIHFNLRDGNRLMLTKQDTWATKLCLKRLKHKSPTIPLAFNRRLLRTRRVLVLPSQVNLTIITNSFDVVHSWYIPGLGLKLDCIPGRSTHHTLFIDHAGFYYGQCAEICGRYHHHMPIRVCALPFEHFLLWWYHYGLPKFNATKHSRKMTVRSGIRQYSW